MRMVSGGGFLLKLSCRSLIGSHAEAVNQVGDLEAQMPDSAYWLNKMTNWLQYLSPQSTKCETFGGEVIT